MGLHTGRRTRVLARLATLPLPLFCTNRVVDKPSVTLLTPTSDAEMQEVRDIFREYASTLGVDLCFQDFEGEMADLPGDYAEPRGSLLLAKVDGAVAGCCALRPLDTAD